MSTNTKSLLSLITFPIEKETFNSYYQNIFPFLTLKTTGEISYFPFHNYFFTHFSFFLSDAKNTPVISSIPAMSIHSPSFDVSPVLAMSKMDFPASSYSV